MQVLCVEVSVAGGLLLQQLHQRGLHTAALVRYLLHLLQQLIPFSAGERRGRGGERGGEGSGEREGRGGEGRRGRGGEWGEGEVIEETVHSSRHNSLPSLQHPYQ